MRAWNGFHTAGTVLLVMGMLLSPVQRAAAGEKTLVDLTARKGTQRATFSVSPEASTYSLTVLCGEVRGRDRVSSAVVWLNGRRLLSPRNFNQNVERIRIPLGQDDLAEGKNVIVVDVAGNPNTSMQVLVTGIFPDPPKAQRALVAWYQDKDFDGYGAGGPMMLIEGSLPPSATGFQWVTRGGDCNDFQKDIYPGTTMCPIYN